MRILLKYPTRGRPQQFLTTLRGWLDNAADLSRIAVLVSYDADDATMTPEVIAEAEKLHPLLIAVSGNSKSKIDACNRDVSEYGAQWEVVLLISDDMWCVRQGWDDIIRTNMARYFPDTDGALWFYDGAQKKINTLECVGYRRWAGFRYLYHPSYFSFFSDNEQTAVGLRDKKLVTIEQSIAHHQHPAWLGGMKRDATYIRNNMFWRQDERNYYERKSKGFPA
jgi:hypothetical protein